MHNAIITAGGRSSRYNVSIHQDINAHPFPALRSPSPQGVRGNNNNKVLADLNGKPVLWHSVKAVLNVGIISHCVITAPNDQISAYTSALSDLGNDYPNTQITFIAGGESRRASVYNGLRHLKELCGCGPEASSLRQVWQSSQQKMLHDNHLIAIHDGARPLLQPEWLHDAFNQLTEDPTLHGIIAAHPVTDTLKRSAPSPLGERVGERGIRNLFIHSTIDRSTLWAVQTPQLFRFDTLLAAHEATPHDADITDDAQLIEVHLGDNAKLLLKDSPKTNIKITTPDDLQLALFCTTLKTIS